MLVELHRSIELQNKIYFSSEKKTKAVKRSISKDLRLHYTTYNEVHFCNLKNKCDSRSDWVIKS